MPASTAAANIEKNGRDNQIGRLTLKESVTL
jgi:hypothetical protein